MLLLQVGVKTIVVYINKADAVNDPEMLELVCTRQSMDDHTISLLCRLNWSYEKPWKRTVMTVKKLP